MYKILFTILCISCSLIPTALIAEPFQWYSVKDVGLHRQQIITIEDVHSLVIILSTKYAVDEQVALRIAKCESNLNHLADNPNSSASGVYQFIDSTWEHYCKGDVYDAEANITCFMQLYPAHPEWWECK